VRDDGRRSWHVERPVRLEEVPLRVAVPEDRRRTLHVTPGSRIRRAPEAVNQIAGGAPSALTSTRTPCASAGRRYQYSPSPPPPPVGPAAATPARRSCARVSSVSALRTPSAKTPSPRADRKAPGGFVSSCGSSSTSWATLPVATACAERAYRPVVSVHT